MLAANPVPGGSDVPTIENLEIVFSNVLGIILGFSGIILFLMLIAGGFGYMTAGGDPGKAEGAKKTMTYALFGIVLTFLAFLILKFLSGFTGITDILNLKIVQ